VECKNCDFWEDGKCHDSDEFIDEEGIDSCRYREGSFLKPSVNKSKLNDGLVAKLIEIDSLIRCVHLDMGGNDKYHISPRHNDQIGKLIKECLYIAEGN